MVYVRLEGSLRGLLVSHTTSPGPRLQQQSVQASVGSVLLSVCAVRIEVDGRESLSRDGYIVAPAPRRGWG
jgi:hypothetical protein